MKKQIQMKLMIVSFMGGLMAIKWTGDFFWLISLIIGSVLLVFFLFKFKDKRKLIILLLLFWLAGGIRWIVDVKVSNADIVYFNDRDEKLILRGQISEVEVKRDGLMAELQVKEVMINGNFRKIEGNVLVMLPRYPEADYGFYVELTGKLQAPRDEGGFSYKNYLARYGIYSVIYADKFKILQIGKGDLCGKWIYFLRNFLRNRLSVIFFEPAASLESGLLLGLRGGISEELTETFKQAGLTHILAISGYNIAMIIVFLDKILFFWGRKRRTPAIGVFIIFFVLLAGAEASAVRAAIMGSLVLLARYSGRKNEAKNALFLTGFLMIFVNPKILFYDAGFQLSFAATAGIIYLAKFSEKLFKRMPDFFCIKESLIVTLSAQIATAPIIFWLFKNMAWISPVTNIFAAPFIPIIMLLGMSALFVSLLSIELARVIGYAGWVVVEGMIRGIEGILGMTNFL